MAKGRAKIVEDAANRSLGVLGLQRRFINIQSRLTWVGLAITSTPNGNIFCHIQLFMSLFLRMIAMGAFVTHIVLRVKFSVLAFCFHTDFVRSICQATDSFHGVTLFGRSGTANRQRRHRLIEDSGIFTRPRTGRRQAAEAYHRRNVQIAKIRSRYAMHAARLQSDARGDLARDATLFRLPIRRVNGCFNIYFEGRNVTAHFWLFTRQFVIFSSTIVRRRGIFEGVQVHVRF